MAGGSPGGGGGGGDGAGYYLLAGGGGQVTFTYTSSASLTITTTSLPNGTQNAAYSATLSATGGTTPYSWSITTGALPAGLILTTTTGVISGTPTATGAFSFTVQVADSASHTATQALSITVNSPPPLTITTTSLPNGTQSAAYSATLSATDGTAPYSWSIMIGALPAGLTLTSTTGVISGTPTATGTGSFTVQVADSASHTATQALSITVNSALPPDFSLSATTPAAVIAGNGTSSTVTVNGLNGFTGTVSLSASNLPSGLTATFNPVSVTGSGSSTLTFQASSATAVGTYSVTVTGTGGGVTRTASILVQVTDFSLSATTPAAVVAGNSTSSTVTVGSLNGFAGTVSLSASISPVSVSGPTASLSPVSIVGSGASTLSIQTSLATLAGSYSVTTTGTSSGGITHTTLISIQVIQPPSIGGFSTQVEGGTVGSTPDAIQNVNYQAFASASGGTPPFTWSLVGGSLPPGLTLTTVSNQGQISGTPTTPGTWTFTLQVTDSRGLTDSRAFSIKVIGIPTISGAHSAWWLGGGSDPTNGYFNQAVLTASCGLGATCNDTPSWTVSGNISEISLSCTSCWSTTVTALGASGVQNDVSLTATTGGLTSAPFLFTTNRPWFTIQVDIIDQSFQDGYHSIFHYKLYDRFEAQMPQIAVNEQFHCPDDATGDQCIQNWKHDQTLNFDGEPQPGGETNWSGQDFFTDTLGIWDCGGCSPAITNPQDPLLQNKVKHTTQTVQAGSATPGNGARVQSDTLQLYTDHGRPNNLVSPVD